MKNTLKLEEAAMLLLPLFLFNLQSPYPWWVFAACFLLPDISMLGYVLNAKTGAWTYNLFHHKGVAVLLYIGGYYLENDLLIFTGLLLFAHASFDRIMGYGLKYETAFEDTHLGKIGRNKR